MTVQFIVIRESVGGGIFHIDTHTLTVEHGALIIDSDLLYDFWTLIFTGGQGNGSHHFITVESTDSEHQFCQRRGVVRTIDKRVSIHTSAGRTHHAFEIIQSHVEHQQVQHHTCFFAYSFVFGIIIQIGE